MGEINAFLTQSTSDKVDFNEALAQLNKLALKA